MTILQWNLLNKNAVNQSYSTAGIKATVTLYANAKFSHKKSCLIKVSNIILQLRSSVSWSSSLKAKSTESQGIAIVPKKLSGELNGNYRNRSGKCEAFETLKNQVEKCKQLKMEMTNDGCGGVYYVREGECSKSLAVFKPSDEEYMAPQNPRGYVQEGGVIGSTQNSMRNGFRIGSGAVREYAAYLLDEAYGNFCTVPVTGITKLLVNGSMKEGSLQAFVSSDSSAEDMGSLKFSVSEVHKIGILDLRLFNTDRHAGNILLSSKADEDTFTMTPIDHGLCLPSYQHLDGACYDWLSWPQSQQPFSDIEKKYIASLDASADAETLRSIGLEEECIVTMRIGTAVLQIGAKNGFSLRQIASIVHRDGDLSQPCQLETLVTSCIQIVKKNLQSSDLTTRVFCDALVEEVIQLLPHIFADLSN